MREAAARRLFYAAIIECLVARRCLGLGVSTSLLARADEVVE
jgi:hypothetical protein